MPATCKAWQSLASPADGSLLDFPISGREFHGSGGGDQAGKEYSCGLGLHACQLHAVLCWAVPACLRGHAGAAQAASVCIRVKVLGLGFGVCMHAAAP